MRIPRLLLCIEQTLGHRAHGMNLQNAARTSGFDVATVDVPYPEGSRLPLPWAVRGSVRARRLVHAGRAADVTLYHTQTVALLAPFERRPRPYVVSVDATPLQLDTMATWYRHRAAPSPVEDGKRAWYRHVFARAAGLVAWSTWAADSMVRDYQAPRAAILVAHPGAREELFAIRRAPESRRPPRILFMGGDFARKGGPALLEAFAPLAHRAELTLVTDAALEVPPGVRVINGVRPGTEAQLACFADADIFCLPTLGDCTSVAIGEAMAAGLALVTTTVGSNSETVADGVTGLLTAPGDASGLGERLRALVDDAALRARLGAAAREHAREHLSSERNARRVLQFMGALRS